MRSIGQPHKSYKGLGALQVKLAYSTLVNCKLYTNMLPIKAADLLNNKVLPFYSRHDLPMLRNLTERGTEYCGRVKQHDFGLYLAVNYN